MRSLPARTVFKSVTSIAPAELFLNLYTTVVHRYSRRMLERRGCKMVIYANDLIGHSINASGFYEWNELETVFDFLSPLEWEFYGGVAIDVGANIGSHSVYFSRRFKEVHAFEPHPLTHRILDINASTHRNIIAYPFGLSDSNDVVNMAENPTNLGGSRIVIDTETGITAIVKRLDDLMPNRPDIVLMKLDVEGHEASVLRGANNVVSTAMPIILFEAHKTNFKGRMEEVEIMRNLGYCFAWIEPHGTGFMRFWNLFTMLLVHRRVKRIVTGEGITPGDHSMVIAVPPRWQKILGLLQS